MKQFGGRENNREVGLDVEMNTKPKVWRVYVKGKKVKGHAEVAVGATECAKEKGICSL
jgi:hypothetical protein